MKLFHKSIFIWWPKFLVNRQHFVIKSINLKILQICVLDKFWVGKLLFGPRPELISSKDQEQDDSRDVDGCWNPECPLPLLQRVVGVQQAANNQRGQKTGGVGHSVRDCTDEAWNEIRKLVAGITGSVSQQPFEIMHCQDLTSLLISGKVLQTRALFENPPF